MKIILLLFLAIFLGGAGGYFLFETVPTAPTIQAAEPEVATAPDGSITGRASVIDGDTYHCSNMLKLLYGARWNPAKRVWTVPTIFGEEAQNFVDKHGSKFRGWELTRIQGKN